MWLITWIIVGLIAGWAAGKIMKGGGYGPLTDILLGMVERWLADGSLTFLASILQVA